jgi:hypothetical protein
MTDTPYDRMHDSYLTDESLADFRHEGPRYLHPSPRYDVCALMDAIVEHNLYGTPYPACVKAQIEAGSKHVSLNAAFDEAVRSVRAERKAAA